MKPSFYLEPNAEKMRFFFRSFSLPGEQAADLETINISKIWVDETENSWKLDYISLKSVDAGILDELANRIKAEFNLNYLYWNMLKTSIPPAKSVEDPIQGKEIRVFRQVLSIRSGEVLHSWTWHGSQFDYKRSN